MNPRLQTLLNKVNHDSNDFYTGTSFQRLFRVAHAANLLNWSIPIITITGTNGKGSTVAALKSIYQNSGYKIGVFTSPHLISYNERIAINNDCIADNEFVLALEFVFKLESADQLSHMQILFLAALYYFSHNGLDALILEVGLGGRLDVTNILDADLVIISTIDLDHQAILGNTIEDIAREKAGLFKRNKQAIYGDTPLPHSVSIAAKQLNINLICFDKDYHIYLYNQAWLLYYQNHTMHFPKRPKLHIKAMASAIIASELLKKRLPIAAGAVNDAVKTVSINGRLQWLKLSNIPILLDVAHNVQAVQCLLAEIFKYSPKGQVRFVYTALKSKNCHEIIRIVNRRGNLWYTSLLSSGRAHDKESMRLIFKKEDIQYLWFQSPIDAFQCAVNDAKPNDLIVVFGSFEFVGDILQYLSS